MRKKSPHPFVNNVNHYIRHQRIPYDSKKYACDGGDYTPPGMLPV